MSDSGENLAVVFDSSISPYAPISSTYTNVQSAHMDLKFASDMSVQIITDGNAKVNWTFQVTNLPPTFLYLNRRVFGTIPSRDDTATSAMWSTLQSGQLGTGGQQGTVLAVSPSIFRVGRLLLAWDSSNTAGSSAQVFSVIRTMGFS